MAILQSLLSIEAFFFAKRKNDALLHEQHLNTFINPKKTKHSKTTEEQFEKFLKNNDHFGRCLEKTKTFTNGRFEKKPRVKTNYSDNNKKYLDKAKFLSKFSCFEGFMQYWDSHWDSPTCQGISFDEFQRQLKANKTDNH